jgi:hypothetical protein
VAQKNAFTGIKTALPKRSLSFAWCDFQWENGDLHQVDRGVPYYRKTSLVFVA